VIAARAALVSPAMNVTSSLRRRPFGRAPPSSSTWNAGNEVDPAQTPILASPVLDLVLHRIRRSVVACEHVITLHALEELDADDLSVVDVESCVLSCAIVERQRGS